MKNEEQAQKRIKNEKLKVNNEKSKCLAMKRINEALDSMCKSNACVNNQQD